MPPNHALKGFFFCFEGGEGSGKSTQAKRLFAWLESQGIPALLTREPGGTLLGKRIRELLLNPSEGPVSDRAELLLYQADRAHHVATHILPALKAGKVVLCDRYVDSSVVYQGICRGLGKAQTEALNRFSTGGLKPDCVVLLDIPAEAGMARVRARSQGAALDRMETEKLVFHKKVRSGFLQLAREKPSRYVVLDARKSETRLETAIREVAKAKLKRRGIWTL
jgi:dTMP kinase